MTKNFSYFLAKRYLVPKGMFLIIINVLTMLGICLGVAVMIVVLSAMLLRYDPHRSAPPPQLLLLLRGHDD